MKKFILLLALAGCHDSDEVAHREAERHVGRGEYHCVNVDGYKQSGMSYCLAGRTLIICDREDCLVVPLDTPTPER